MKRMIAAALMTLLPLAAAAQAAGDRIVTQGSDNSVPETVDRLTAAAERAGATVFAVVNHGKGARTTGEEIGNSQLVILGNPALGTPAILDNRQAALFLPLRVLVYENEGGQALVAYESPARMFDALGGIPADAEYLARMTEALEQLVAEATR